MIYTIPILIASVFEILASPKFGFYFLPALLCVSIFSALPFVFPWLNILIAFSASLAVSFIWAVYISEMHLPSLAYTLHIFIYLILIASSVISVYFTQKK